MLNINNFGDYIVNRKKFEFELTKEEFETEMTKYFDGNINLNKMLIRAMVKYTVFELSDSFVE